MGASLRLISWTFRQPPRERPAVPLSSYIYRSRLVYGARVLVEDNLSPGALQGRR